MIGRKAEAVFFFAAVLAAGCQSVPPENRQPIPREAPTVSPAVLPTAAVPGTPAPALVPGVELRTAPAAPAGGKKTKALLVVQNHGGSAETTLLHRQIGDWIASALGAGAFAVVDPHDLIGTTQNVGPWGETMPLASATSLAEQIGAEVLLTASVSDVHVRRVGGTDPGVVAVADLTLSAKAVPGGESLASVNYSARSAKQPDEEFLRANAGAIWSAVAKEAAYGAAPALQAEWAKRTAPEPAAVPVRVRFSSSVSGANLRIDGTSRGTLGPQPLELAVSPGVHNLEISYPGMVPFEEAALFRDGASFEISFAFTPEAAAAAKRDELFATLLERARKSGLTDDLVRETVAAGYARYLSASHTRLDGMPQTIGGDAPSLGLAPLATESPSPVPTTNDLLDRAEDATR